MGQHYLRSRIDFEVDIHAQSEQLADAPQHPVNEKVRELNRDCLHYFEGGKPSRRLLYLAASDRTQRAARRANRTFWGSSS